jgi:hypothetical protein
MRISASNEGPFLTIPIEGQSWRAELVNERHQIAQTSKFYVIRTQLAGLG